MEELKIPNHVAIILDGNRRYAKQHNIPKLEGHRKGFKNIRKLSKYIFDKGIKYLSVYAFSTENFNRSYEEVKYLMDMFVREFKKEYEELNKNNVKVVFSGRRNGLREDVLEAMDEISCKTKNNTGGIFNVCINYGGHAEITDTMIKLSKMLLEHKIDIEDINEELIEKNLYQDLPPVDLMIRTGGDLRISNFLLWQISYAEMYFPKVCFPGFNEEEFDNAILAFNGRERRFGGDSNCDKES